MPWDWDGWDLLALFDIVFWGRNWWKWLLAIAALTGLILLLASYS